MKRLFSFLAIIGIILASNCSRIPENNDPVIGIWSDTKIQSTNKAEKQTTRKEWIFNDAYLGRFHEYQNDSIAVLTDFKWTEDGGTYTLSYPGIKNRTDDIVTMIKSKTVSALKDSQGNILATRE